MTRIRNRLVTAMPTIPVILLVILGGVFGCSKSRPGPAPQDSLRLLDAIDADEQVVLGNPEKVLVETWELDEGADEWTGSNDVADLRLDGPLAFRSTGVDAFVFREGLSIDAALVDRIDIELEVDQFVTMPQLYWKTADRPQFDGAMSTQIAIPRDASMPTTVSVTLAGHPAWTGTVTGLRIDPTDVPGANVTLHEINAYATPFETPRRTAVLVDDEWRRVRVAPIGDDWTVAVRAEDAQALRFAIAPLPYSTNIGAASLRFRIDVVGASRRSLFDETLAIDASRSSYAYDDVEVALEANDVDGGVLTLRLRVDGAIADGAKGDPRKLAGVWAAPIVMDGPAPEEAPLNLVVFSLDTLRADRLGGYGYGRTTSPVIDRLARNGTTFAQASSQAPETLASHMSIMTGRMPSAHAVVGDVDALAEDYDTIAESFLAKGYHTAAYTEGGYIDGHFGFHAGFQRYHNGSGPTPEAPGGDVERTFARGRAWLDRFGQEPFFLFLHTYEIHVPYAPPAEFRRFGPEGYAGTFLDTTIDHHRHIIPINNGDMKAEEVDRAYIEGLYDGEIAYTDREVGRVLAHLEDLGVADRTVVVILSDHGEEFDEHGVFGMHGHSLYEEMVHVPFVLAGPGIARGRVLQDPVGLYDLYPTLADLFDVEAPDDLEGHSLAPLVRPQSSNDAAGAAGRTIISEDGTVYPRISLREAGWRFIKTRGVESWWVEQVLAQASEEFARALLDVKETELYDLSDDPRDLKDVADAEPTRLGTFLERCDELLTRAAEIRRRYGADEAGGGSIDPKKQEQLRLLGYMSGDPSKVLSVSEVHQKLEAQSGGGSGADDDGDGAGNDDTPHGG